MSICFLSFPRRRESRFVFYFWIPAPRFCGDKFTPAEAGAGMTGKLKPFLQNKLKLEITA